MSMIVHRARPSGTGPAPKVLLKYTFKYLAEPVGSAPTNPVQRGVENGVAAAGVRER